MKKIIIWILVFLLFVWLMWSSDQDNTDKLTITMEEFREVKVGYSMKKAIEIIWWTWTISSEWQYGTINMNRDGDTFMSTASIMFQKGRVAHKSQFGLE
jgi:hypothetical protein